MSNSKVHSCVFRGIIAHMVIVIECESCRSRYRLAKVLFKKSKAINVRCRKCGECILVDNPDYKDTGEALNGSPRSDAWRAKVDLLKEIDAAAPETSDIPSTSYASREKCDPRKNIDAAPETPDASSDLDASRVKADLLKEIEMAATETSDIPSAPDKPRAKFNLFQKIGLSAPDTPDVPPASDVLREKTDFFKEIGISDQDTSDILSPDVSRVNADPFKEIDFAAPETLDTPPSDTSRMNADLLKEMDMAAPGIFNALPTSLPEEDASANEEFSLELDDMQEARSREASDATPPDSSLSEPSRNVESWEIVTRPAHSGRPGLRFLFVMLLWVMLLAAAVLFFETNYFERWFPNYESRPSANFFFR